MWWNGSYSVSEGLPFTVRGVTDLECLYFTPSECEDSSQ